MPVLLTEKDVRMVLSMEDLIATMETALEQFSSGGVRQPLRSIVDVSRGAGQAFYGVMPAFVGAPAALGTKLVSVYHGNAERGLPSHLATIILHDPETGALQAILDGRYITEARTAAASAASAKHLARKDARVLAVLGSGVQARSHIDAMARVRPFDAIRVWGRHQGRVQALLATVPPHARATLIAADSPEEATEGADVIALVTASREPVLTRTAVKPGAHICAVGACRPDQREMDTALVRDARLFVDSRAGALAEAGDIVIPIKEGAFDATHIAGELGDVFGGRLHGRESDDQITIF